MCIRSTREVVAFVCVVLVASLGLVMCRPPGSAHEAAAEAAYAGELLRCVDKATTLAESKACRAEVDRRWNITQTTTEAGD